MGVLREDFFLSKLVAYLLSLKLPPGKAYKFEAYFCHPGGDELFISGTRITELPSTATKEVQNEKPA